MTFFVLEKLADIDYREEIMTLDEEKIKFDAEQTKAWFPKEPKSKKQFIRSLVNTKYYITPASGLHELRALEYLMPLFLVLYLFFKNVTEGMLSSDQRSGHLILDYIYAVIYGLVYNPFIISASFVF